MKIGIALTGISYGVGTTHRFRDFRETSANFFDTIYNPLAENHQVSVYTTTYPNEHQDELLATYKPVKHQFISLEGSHMVSTFMHGLCLVEGEDLDVLICTRFDLWWKKKITDLPINYEKFNFLFKERTNWDKNKFVTDNLYVLPFRFFYDFAEAVQNLAKENLFPNHVFMHHIYQYVLAEVGEQNVQFISPVPEDSHNNQFYDLKRIEV